MTGPVTTQTNISREIRLSEIAVPGPINARPTAMPGKAIAAHAQALTAFLASGSRAAGVLSSSGAGAGRLGGGRTDGEVGGESIQVRVGPGRKHLADPQVKLVLLQPALDEGGLELLDHPLAVRVRCPYVAAAFDACSLVSGPDHDRRLPPSRHTDSLARPSGQLFFDLGCREGAGAAEGLRGGGR